MKWKKIIFSLVLRTDLRLPMQCNPYSVVCLDFEFFLKKLVTSYSFVQ